MANDFVDALQDSINMNTENAVALDSGAVKHVTPENVFSLTTDSTDKSRTGHNYYGADGSAIANLGGQNLSAYNEEGKSIALEFDVAKVSPTRFSR